MEIAIVIFWAAIYLWFWGLIVLQVINPKQLKFKHLIWLLPIPLCAIWLLLPYENRYVEKTLPVKVEIHGQKGLLISQENEKIWTKVLDVAPSDKIEWELVFYSRDAGYFRKYFSSHEFRTRK